MHSVRMREATVINRRVSPNKDFGFLCQERHVLFQCILWQFALKASSLIRSCCINCSENLVCVLISHLIPISTPQIKQKKSKQSANITSNLNMRALLERFAKFRGMLAWKTRTKSTPLFLILHQKFEFNSYTRGKWTKNKSRSHLQ